MDDDGNVKTSTIMIGVASALALTLAGGLIAEAFFSRLFTWAFMPAVIFSMIYIEVHRRRARGGRR